MQRLCLFIFFEKLTVKCNRLLLLITVLKSQKYRILMRENRKQNHMKTDVNNTPIIYTLNFDDQFQYRFELKKTRVKRMFLNYKNVFVDRRKTCSKSDTHKCK